MTLTKWVCVVLLAALAGMLVQPARAEALEPMFISLIVGAAVVVVVLVAILIIANVTEGRQRTVGQAVPEPVTLLVALQPPATESP